MVLSGSGREVHQGTAGPEQSLLCKSLYPPSLCLLGVSSPLRVSMLDPAHGGSPGRERDLQPQTVCTVGPQPVLPLRSPSLPLYSMRQERCQKNRATATKFQHRRLREAPRPLGCQQSDIHTPLGTAASALVKGQRGQGLFFTQPCSFGKGVTLWASVYPL